MNSPRIRLWSDLHIEMPGNRGILTQMPREADADLVILAGDIGHGSDGVLRAANWFSDRPPIAYVLGNHELYGGEYEAVLAECREVARGTNVRVLERDVWDFMPRLRLLGCTLWTDYALWGEETIDAAMREAYRMADFRLIRTEGRAFRPADALRLHQESRAWLEAELARAKRDDVTVIVVTHHAPHELLLEPEYREERALLSASFASDLGAILDGPNSPWGWCSGHTHAAGSYARVVGSTALMRNQGGYRWMGECPDFEVAGLRLPPIA